MSTFVLVHGAWHTGAELEPTRPTWRLPNPPLTVLKTSRFPTRCLGTRVCRRSSACLFRCPAATNCACSILHASRRRSLKRAGIDRDCMLRSACA